MNCTLVRIGTLLRLCTVATIAISTPVSAAQFFFETVDFAGRTGFWPSIAVGQDQIPRIAYLDLDRFFLRYAQRPTAGWTSEDVASGNDRGQTLSLDGSGAPLIVFVAAGAETAWRDAGTWRHENLAGCYLPSATAMSRAPDGSFHATVIGSCSGGIYYGSLDYAVRTSTGEWSTTAVETRIDNFAFGGYCSIVASSSTDPHIATRNDYSGIIGHLYKSSGNWVREPIARGTWSSIALDAMNVPHVALYDDIAHTLRFAVRGPSGWSSELVDGEGDVGRSCSLVIAADGYHIAYYDATNGDVKYAHRAAETTGWTIQTVASEGDVGANVSLAVDPRGAVHIAYYDKTGGDLKYATTDRRVGVRASTWSIVRSQYR